LSLLPGICGDRALAGLIKRAGRRFRLLGGGASGADADVHRSAVALGEFSKNAVEILCRDIATGRWRWPV